MYQSACHFAYQSVYQWLTHHLIHSTLSKPNKKGGIRMVSPFFKSIAEKRKKVAILSFRIQMASRLNSTTPFSASKTIFATFS